MKTSKSFALQSLIATSAFFFCLTGAIQAQPCSVFEIVLATQQDVDAFTTNHPNCNEEVDKLTITGGDITNLAGLSNIESVDFLTIQQAPNLASLVGFEALQSVGFFIIDNTGIVNLQGLDNLELVDHLFVVSNNPDLVDFTGLSRLKYVSSFYIDFNTSLESLHGLDSLERADGLAISNNPILPNLSGMPRLQHTDHSLYIYNNDLLQNLVGLEYLKSIDFEFTIDDNASLTSLTTFPLLAYAIRLNITNNPVLTSLSSFPVLTLVGAEFTIRGNGSLTTLAGLESLRRVNGRVKIVDNIQLQSLSGLDSLLVINEILEIADNPVLTDLSALTNLGQVDDLLSIENNDALTTLAGLDNIATLGSLQILFNDQLSYCSVESVCNHLSQGGISDVGGNTGDCHNEAEILQNCLVASDDPLAKQIAVYPNPAVSVIHIAGLPYEEVYIKLYDSHGKVYSDIKPDDQEIDMSAFTPGYYILQIRTAKFSVVRSVVKM